MASFPSPLTSPQLATLRTSGYWARVLCCLCPEEVVFRAQASETISDTPFIDFTYDNVDVGSFSAAWEGMVCYISSTNSIRDAKYRGRVRLAADATTFRIDRNATVLNDNDKIIVVRDTDLFSRIRIDTLVDSAIPYHSTPDVLTGLPSTIVLYDSDNDGDVSYTTVQSPVRVASGSTSTSTWAWSVSGAGASSISNAAIQNPTITFEAGYHYLLRVVHTNNLGQTNYQMAHVYAITRTLGLPCIQSIVTGTVSADLENGWTASLTAYAQVETLLDRTHCAVFSIEHFGDNSSTPVVSNVLMNGRIRSDSIQTEGSAEAGRVQSVTFTVEGITAYLRRERIPNDIIRADAAPNEWGEMIAPNPWRMAIYAAWMYTTLTNICSLGADSGSFADWEIGGEPRGIDGGYVYDVLANILDPIKAAVNFAPDGSLFLARTVSYLSDRSGVQTIATLTLGDLIEYSVDRDSSNTTSQVIAYGGMFNSTTNTFDVYSAQSPSIIYLEGEIRELNREILAADSTIDDAASELKDRASNHYGAENPKPLFQGQIFDSWAGVLIPTNYQRWNATLPASSNTLGLAYGASDYWQLQSVNLQINPDGTIDTSFEAPAETSFDDAQSLAAPLPNNLSNMNPVLPILPNDPAFPTDALENYPTLTPDTDDLQALDPFSGMQAYTPFPPDVAADIALNLPAPRCKVLAVNFRSDVNTESSWTTVLNDPYTLTFTGFARISGGFPGCTDLTTTPERWADSAQTKWYSGSGFGPTHAGGVEQFIIDRTPDTVGVTITELRFAFNEPFTNVRVTVGILGFVVVNTDGDNMIIINETNAPALFPFNTGPTNGAIQVRSNAFNVIIPSATLRMTSFCMYTAVGTEIFADWAYQWEQTADGTMTNISLLPDGLYIDNAQYDPTALGAPFPPISPTHRYTGLPFTGTGNSFLARMELGDYSATESAYLNIQVCPEGVTPS